MPALTLTTDRLVLRRFTPDDAGFIYELFSHEDEMRFAPDAKTYRAYWERYPLHWVETL